MRSTKVDSGGRPDHSVAGHGDIWDDAIDVVGEFGNNPNISPTEGDPERASKDTAVEGGANEGPQNDVVLPRSPHWATGVASVW